MKAIITADSETLDKRILTFLTGISGLEIVASVKNVQEAFIFIKEYEPDILIISPRYLTSSAFDTLRDIRIYNEKLIVIVLTENTLVEYSKMWEAAGVNFIFDQTMQFNQMIELLCSLLYTKQYNAILAENDLNREHQNHF